MVVWRCTEKHRGGRPKLAEAYMLTPTSVLVVSQIAWLPSDQLTLRPWDREHHLGAGLEAGSLARILVDDKMLSDWLDRLDEWQAGLPSTGPRWLRGANPVQIVTQVCVHEDPPVTPWVRCKDHPREADFLRRADIFAAFR